jgi:hypothetical protein
MLNQCENIVNPKRKCWNNEEISKLKFLYETEGKSLSELKSLFPNRSEVSIRLKIKKLKLKHTKEQKTNIWSKVRMGNKNPRFGKSPPTKGYTKNTLECLRTGGEKLSKTIQKKILEGKWNHTKGCKNGMYGKTPWCKGLTKKTSSKIKEASKKSSITMKNKYEYLLPDEKERLRQKILSSMTDSVKYKMRLSAIKRIERMGVNKACRNYNVNACEYFDKLNRENGWNLQHAKNGGEIEIYGYFLDAYDKERNIVVEYDEPRHDRPHIKKKDTIRQNNIIKHLGECKFYRFKELSNQLIQIQ